MDHFEILVKKFDTKYIFIFIFWWLKISYVAKMCDGFL